MTSLIERLEAAEVGTRELDAQIVVRLLAPHGASAARSRFNGEWCVYFGERSGEPKLWEPHGRDGMLKRLPFTTSMDAALALAERVLPGWAIGVQIDALGTLATLSQPDVDMGDDVIASADLMGLPEIDGEARTAPLALCAAILRSQPNREMDNG